MLFIECPFCGSRDETEFHCGGEAHIMRPGPAEAVEDEAWADYLFYRENPKGYHFERWVHSHGCGQWFHIVRNTQTHEIVHAYPIDQAKPKLALT